MGFAFKHHIFQPRDDVSRDLTTVDVLKTVAVVLMLIDHIGFYLFPDVSWFRVLGRLCVPLWFFLIGFSDRRDVPWQWFAGGGILLLATLLTGHGPWPLSILFTMAIIRFTINPVWDYISARPVYFWWFVLLFGFFGYATDRVVEYGTIGFLLASVGYVLKHKTEVNARLGEGMHQHFTIVALLVFGVLQGLVFGFSVMQSIVLAAGLIGMFFVLQDFEVKYLPDTAAMSQAPLIRFCGRYSLEIYVIHLLILKAVLGFKILVVNLLG
jgi:hypothetical protein